MAPILFVLFIIIPIVELAIIIQVGQVVGTGWTIVALIAVSLVGAALVKSEGLRAWRRVREALAEARMPAEEVVDGALVLLGGALMLTPGFLTDGVGLFLVVPVTRGLINRGIRGRVRSAFGLRPPRRRGVRRRPPESPSARHSVVDVDVVSVERDDPRSSD
ncbi:MAG TPA: FxsA family protein [Egibacteraceae bacterium]|nr:FxsA family protein [Egibacteraceae bacterium]